MRGIQEEVFILIEDTESTSCEFSGDISNQKIHQMKVYSIFWRYRIISKHLYCSYEHQGEIAMPRFILFILSQALVDIDLGHDVRTASRSR